MGLFRWFRRIKASDQPAGVKDDAAPPAPLRPPTEDEKLLIARRTALAASVTDQKRVPTQAQVPNGSLGLALSGGGIRSATLSLGLVQAFSRNDRLFDFDYLSTVSGGGYFGTFLGSLFVPSGRRGRLSPAKKGQANKPDKHGKIRGLFKSALQFVPGAARDQRTPAARPLDFTAVRGFVEKVLDTDANEETTEDPETPGARMRNPIWWLREHGRYLAPNGPTDYMYATAVISRNWLAMIYTFMIFALNIFFLLTLAAWYLIRWCAPTLPAYLHWPMAAGPASPPEFAVTVHGALTVSASVGKAAVPPFDLSPFLVLPAMCVMVAMALGLGFWLTASLDTMSRWSTKARLSPPARFVGQAGLVFAVTLVLIGLAWRFDNKPSLIFWTNDVHWAIIAFAMDLILAGSLIAMMIGLLLLCTAFRDDGFTNELRRRLTNLNAFAINLALWMLGLSVVDTIALAARRSIVSQAGGHSLSLLPVAAAPIVAWLFSKLPQWFGGGKLMRLLGDHLWTIAFVAGALAFMLLAILADLSVQLLVWPGGAWPGASARPEQGLAIGVAIPFLIITMILGVLTGLSNGFVNLSSLNNFYAGRLTRAYIGAANFARLRQAVDGKAPITENHPGDYIDIMQYWTRKSFAPIHLINVTLNETRSRNRSQLVDRDRKGVPIVFGPAGVLINAGRGGGDEVSVSWADLEKNDVDALSLGQLCAISGAAASTGMGSRTTLGGALAFTFANVRLGYWWTINRLLTAKRLEGDGQASTARTKWRLPAFLRLSGGPLATYYFLFNEMTARYSLADPRVYLSDGGHFENSGAYELLRRRVKVIVVGDFGEDPGYVFEDLENLVRKARIDLGLSINIAPPETVNSIFGEAGTGLFLNQFGGAWRKHAANPKDGFALLLNVFEKPNMPAREIDFGKLTPIGRIIWLKPKLINGLPEDIRGYAAHHPGFPQQGTGDQFFDEAQWECYRAIGYALGQQLMTVTSPKRDALRKAIRETCAS